MGLILILYFCPNCTAQGMHEVTHRGTHPRIVWWSDAIAHFFYCMLQREQSTLQRFHEATVVPVHGLCAMKQPWQSLTDCAYALTVKAYRLQILTTCIRKRCGRHK